MGWGNTRERPKSLDDLFEHFTDGLGRKCIRARREPTETEREYLTAQLEKWQAPKFTAESLPKLGC